MKISNLAQHNIYNYKEILECKVEMKIRELYPCGIAIIQDYKHSQSKSLDQYKKEVENLKSWSIGLYQIDQDTEMHKHIDATINILLLPAIIYVESYNTIIDIIAEEYKIPELKELKMDNEDLKHKIQSYNNLIFLTYDMISGKEEQKKQKINTLKNTFKIIEYSNSDYSNRC